MGWLSHQQFGNRSGRPAVPPPARSGSSQSCARRLANAAPMALDDDEALLRIIGSAGGVHCDQSEDSGPDCRSHRKLYAEGGRREPRAGTRGCIGSPDADCTRSAAQIGWSDVAGIMIGQQDRDEPRVPRLRELQGSWPRVRRSRVVLRSDGAGRAASRWRSSRASRTCSTWSGCQLALHQ
jgi:hypothetical protein